MLILMILCPRLQLNKAELGIVALYKISSSRVNNIEADQFTGSVVEQGLIWYDPSDGVLRLYNGEVGGYIINSGGSPTNQISNGNSNVVVNSDGRVTVSVNGMANVAVFEGPQAQFDSVFSTGNVTTDGYFIGDGSQLTGITVQVPGVFGLIIDGGNAAVASSDFIVDGGSA
jgi:hypothetical protein